MSEQLEDLLQAGYAGIRPLNDEVQVSKQVLVQTMAELSQQSTVAGLNASARDTGGWQTAAGVPEQLLTVAYLRVQVTKEARMQWLEDLHRGTGNALHSADNSSQAANAYRLVYVRQSEWDNIMKEIPVETIPPAVRQHQEVRQNNALLLRLLQSLHPKRCTPVSHSS